MKIKNSIEALNLFEQCSIKQAHATEIGDYRISNKYFDILMKCIVYLYDTNSLGLLHDYLTHPNIGVRMNAAYALLPIEKELSETVLSELVNSKDVHGSDAYWTLKEWREGNLLFPYQEGFGKK